MPELEPIVVEITEDQTVIMEIDGVEHVLYVGKPRQKAAPAPKKPAPKAKPKPVVKPAPKKEPIIIVAPAPAPKPEPKKPIIPPKRSTPLRPTRDFVDFGPGLSDDSQHSIHTISFEEKVALVPEDIRANYEALSKYMVETYGCNHRVSFGYDSYRIGKKVVAALSLGGVHVRLNTCLDPKFYEGTKMKVNDDSNSKKYKDLPSYIKVMSEKTLKQAHRLIDDTMKSIGVKKIA